MTLKVEISISFGSQCTQIQQLVSEILFCCQPPKYNKQLQHTQRDTRLMASFPGQPGEVDIRKVKPITNQELMALGWHSYQLNHMQIIAPHSRQIIVLPLASNRRHRSNGDCLEGKTENYQVCSVQYCVQQLCTVQCTHI